MRMPTVKSHARKMTMPPTPPSEEPHASPLALSTRANALPSSPTSDLHTPRERRNISNRFWEQNEPRAQDGAPGIDLASDSSDPNDNSEAARTKKHNHLHLKIKRLLALETGAVRIKTLESNETVREYNKLLEAFAHKPKTKRKRARYTEALRVFLEDHGQILDVYEQYAVLDRELRKDRILPEFVLDEASAKKDDKDHATDVRRAPAKRALNEEDESDEEGFVTQTVKSGEDFDEASVFNTRGLSVPSIFGRKTSATTEKNERRFLLYRRDVSLMDGAGGEGFEKRTVKEDEEQTPSRPPSKKRRLA